MFYDAANNVVAYNTPNSKLLELTQGGKTLAYNGFKAIPATLFNLQVARYLGFPVPPILNFQYDWPRDRREIPVPFKAQIITANFLALHPRAFCLSDMGTGKTLAALWAADYVMSQNLGLKCLIVAPLSTLNRVWSDAIFQNFLGRRSCTVLHAAANKRRDLLKDPHDFYIINYDGVKVLEQELEIRPDIRMIIVDEASAYKDRTTRRHRLARKLIAPKDYLWLLTGTPTPNAPTDAWGLSKLVNNCYGESFGNFHARSMYQISKWKWVPRLGAHQLADRLMQPSVRFAIEDCQDLPPCTIQFRDVELSKQQYAAYQELRKTAILITRQGPITAANEAVIRLKLKQICAGAVYGPGASDADRPVHLLDCSPRLAVLDEIIEQAHHKIIIFAPFTSVVEMLHSRLAKDHDCEMINGATPQAKRNKVFSDFQKSQRPRIIIADPGTMAHGLTLTAATVTVWFSPTDKTEQYLQANKRTDRPGQLHPTTIINLAATPLEREIYRRLAANESLMGLTLLLAKERTDAGTQSTNH
jgi:SNF2 family DNA or RNA helicase